VRFRPRARCATAILAPEPAIALVLTSIPSSGIAFAIALQDRRSCARASFLETDMFRTTAALTMLLCVSAVPARAADALSEPPLLFARLLVPPSLAAPAPALLPGSRGSALPALYVGFAALELYDGLATTAGLRGGAAEANPLVGGAAGNGPALWAIKGGATVGVIYLSERLWRQHHRGQAIGVMLASNGIMAVVAARNTRALPSR
jgi:hypothetical protein